MYTKQQVDAMNKQYSEEVKKAWHLFKRDVGGTVMDVDYWEAVPHAVQLMYLEKAND